VTRGHLFILDRMTLLASSRLVRRGILRSSSRFRSSVSDDDTSQEEILISQQAYYEVRCHSDRYHTVSYRISCRLNSALSVRIEELSAQISALLSENAELRADQISLRGQLRREQEKSRMIMSEAEAAVRHIYCLLQENVLNVDRLHTHRHLD
jgi:regulator of replication initiation timing